MSSLVHFCLFLVIFTSVTASPSLGDLFEALVKKQNEVKNKQLMDFIRKSVPQGIDPPQPKIAEYETFKQDRSANFISDGHGSVVFRQFRRLKLADVFQRRNRGLGI